MIKLNAMFYRKENSFETSPCIIEKTIFLDESEYDEFKNNLLSDHSIISDNVDCMYKDDNGIMHCLLVLGDGSDDGILIESEGYNYARYSAHIPNAWQMFINDTQYESLKTFNNQMRDAVANIVKDAIRQSENGIWRVLKSDLEVKYNLRFFNLPILHDMLNERDEIEFVDDFKDEFVIQFDQKYCMNFDNKKPLRSFSQEEVENIAAKHLLWVHGAGGEQADFSYCDLSNLDLGRMRLNNAIFDGALFDHTDINHSEFCFASFNKCKMIDCINSDIIMEEASFQNAKIINCSFSHAIMTHANFTNTDFTKTVFEHVRMDNCILKDTKFNDSDISSVELRRCIYEEQDLDESSGPVLSM